MGSALECWGAAGAGDKDPALTAQWADLHTLTTACQRISRSHQDLGRNEELGVGLRNRSETLRNSIYLGTRVTSRTEGEGGRVAREMESIL